MLQKQRNRLFAGLPVLLYLVSQLSGKEKGEKKENQKNRSIFSAQKNFLQTLHAFLLRITCSFSPLNA
jgi:hypothetical protein